MIDRTHHVLPRAHGLSGDGAYGGLGSDARGAILVPAIVMGALLVGALFFVAAAGDAIIFRTQLQDAADTTTFTSAVWHAKGMNIVAVINIFMSLLLVVIVLFHVVELICLLVSLFPPAAPVALNLVRSLIQLEDRVSRGISSGLDVLQVSQQAVVVAVPYIAAFNAKRMPTAADTVWPGSMALLPVPLDRALGQDSRMPELGPAALPVQEDEFGTLCTRATLVIPQQVVGLIERIGDRVPWPFTGAVKDKLLEVWGRVEEQIENVTDAGDGILCQPVTRILAEFAGQAAEFAQEQVVGDACGGEFENGEQERADQEARADGATTTTRDPNTGEARPPEPESGSDTDSSAREPTAQDRRATNRRRSAHVDGCASGIADGLSRSSGFNAVPAQVWTAAANGNVFMHTWTRVSGTPRLFNTDRRFLAMADRGRAPSVTPSAVAVAEAEFYLDCEGKWSECQSDALWAPNWTARMRRFRWPTEELAKMGRETVFDFGTVLSETGFDQAEGLISRAFGQRNQFVGDVFASFIVSNAQKIPLFEDLVEKANAAIAEGVEAAGLSDLLELRHSDDKRIH